MTSKVTYELELTPENATKIDAVNRIILGTAYTTVESKIKSTQLEQKATAESAKKKANDNIAADEAKVKAQVQAEQEAEEPKLTISDLKKAAKKAKTEHGEEFVTSVLNDHGVDEKPSLLKRLAAVSVSEYEVIIGALESAPEVKEEVEEEDDGFGDEEESTPTVSADSVKTALKAYAKEHGREEAKEIMSKYKVTALSKVDDCDSATLVKLMKELV